MARRTVSRRKFLTRGAIVASAVIAGPTLFDIEELFAQTTFTRRNVGSLTASSSAIVGYKRAINAMRALPASNPTSWAYQAAIHGTTVMPARTAWNTCQHGNFFFLSWHRMYLYWFERIVRSKSGVATWALPFWDYAAPAQRRLPAMFRTPSDPATNPLYVAARRTALNDGTGSLSSTIVSPSVALSRTAFTGRALTFGGNNPGTGDLEQRPHNEVHVAIGGWMGDPNTAAQDPIFWLHHANIDRYWNVWLKQGGGRSNPIGNATWRGRRFIFFRENGTAVQMTACDILNAAIQLRYRYQDEPSQVTQNCPPMLAAAAAAPVVQQVARRELPIPIPEPEMIVATAEPVVRTMEMATMPAEAVSAARAAVTSRSQTVLLELGVVEAAEQPGVIFDVWVGLEGLPDENTPRAHHVGTIALFALGVHKHMARGHEGEHRASFVFPLDSAIGPALARNADRIRIVIVPRDPVEVGGRSERRAPASPLRITDMRVTLEDRQP
ncbi:MAG TPA: tyrosinase family protein [Thermoanaerobaculia bacterium]|jgi:tyrosinase